MKTKQKPFMIPGLGEKPSLYKTRKLFKYATIADMDWNTGKFKPQIPLGTDVGIGFSMGCHMILETAYKRKSLKTLVLCSMTPGVQSLSILKSVERYIFISGEKETWIQEDLERLLKTISASTKIETHIVKRGDHIIKGEYEKKLIEVINSL